MTTRQQAKNARHEKIIDAAYTLFLAQGIGSVQMLEIAKVVGVSNATLFRYFANKAAIILAVMDRFMQDAGRDMQKITTMPLTAYEKLEKMFTYFMATTPEVTQKLVRYLEATEYLAAVEGIEVPSSTTMFSEVVDHIIETGKQDQSFHTTIDLKVAIHTAFTTFSYMNMKIEKDQTLPFAQKSAHFDIQMSALKDMLLRALAPVNQV